MRCRFINCASTKCSFFVPFKAILSFSFFSQFGDPILLLFESNIQGFLAFPKPSVGSSQCDDRNAAGVYANQTYFEIYLGLFQACRIKAIFVKSN